MPAGRSRVGVLGDCSVELRMKVSRFPAIAAPAEALTCEKWLGGRGVAQALACARLGAETVLIAKTGRDSHSDFILCALAAEQVRSQAVIKQQDASTGFRLVHEDESGSCLETVFPGANRSLDAADIFGTAREFSHAGALLISMVVPEEAARAAIRLGAGSRASIVVDSGPEDPLESELLELVDVLRVRSGHVQRWSGTEVLDRDSARIAAERLIWRGARAVIVDAGPEEKILLQDERELHLPRYSLDPFEPEKPLALGTRSVSDDVFSAALAVALAEGHSIFEAATFANAAAALAPARPRAARQGLPFRRAVLELLRRDGIDYSERTAAA